MSNPVPGGGRPDPAAEHASPQPRAGESTRRQPSPGQRSTDEAAGAYTHPEAQLGGADSIEKTTYVVGEGTEPDTRTRGSYVARGAAGGSNVGVWIVGGIAALIALVYMFGILG